MISKIERLMVAIIMAGVFMASVAAVVFAVYIIFFADIGFVSKALIALIFFGNIALMYAADEYENYEGDDFD